MSERKVLNKYYPPNFDPERIPKNRQPKDKQHIVRLMTPYSMRCLTCSEYIYKGKKFNARKETVHGADYLGIKIYRFYIRCPMCSAEITYKTDPKSRDYAAEHGAVRNFEPWREEEAQAKEKKKRRLAEEENDPMRALENRTFDSKREMDIMDALDEVRLMNAAHEKVDVDRLLEETSQKKTQAEVDETTQKKLEEDEDEQIVRQLFPSSSSDKKPKGAAMPFHRPAMNPKNNNIMFTASNLGIAPKKNRL